MKSSSIPNKTTVLALNQKAIQGVETYLAHVKQLTIAGATYAPADLKATLQAEIDANNTADEGRAQYRQQVVAARVARSKGSAIRKVLKTYVLSNYGADAVQMLENFGMPVPKPIGKRTAKATAQAVAEAQATRKAHEAARASVDAPATAAPAQAAAAPSKS